MAVHAGPDITDNRLVLLYDEGNPRSGTSSELVSGRAATIQSTTERRFPLDSLIATTYASVAQYNNSAPSPGTGFSFSIWFRRTGNSTGGWDQLIGIDGGGPRYRMLWFGFYAGSLSQIHCSMPYYVGTNNSTWYDLNPNFSNVQISFQINTWYNFTATYNNSTRLLSNYINGRFAVSGTRPGLGDLNNPNGSPIQLFGCNGVSSQNSQQRFFSMYNYALSQAEVTQNYNALRGRFELQ